MRLKEATLASEEWNEHILPKVLDILNRRHYPQVQKDRFTEKAIRALNSCRAQFGEEMPIQYSIRRHMGRIALKIVIKGEKLNPVQEDDDTYESITRLFSRNNLSISIGVSMFFYNAFGAGDMTIDLGQLVQMLLRMIPDNIATPFVNNDMAQLVIMGFAMGAALLLLEYRAAPLTLF